MYDVLLKNGLVLDGTKSPGRITDIGLQDEKIVAIGELDPRHAKELVDCSGLAVSPGFIDPHVHSDLLCTVPEIHKIKALQGVTTELFGQDGISVAPVSDETKPLWQNQLRGLNGDIGDWDWNSIEEYLTFLESKMIGNAAYLVPHGAVRTLVMGFDGRISTKDEREKMKQLVEEGMREGAIGISTGLVYPPNVFSDKEELIEICHGAAKFDGCFVVHIRNESTHSIEALKEVVDVARQTGVRLHISHFKVIGEKNRHKYNEALKIMDDALLEGITISFDQYPYTAASTVFHAILPPWVHDGGSDKMISRLKDQNVRKKIEQDFKRNTSYENWVLNCGWENIVITSVQTHENKRFEGKSVTQIAKMWDKSPFESALDLLIEEEGSVTMIIHWGCEDDVISAMKHPLQMVGSDGIFGGKPHPRLYGTFPRILGRYVRENETLSLEEAVHKMTALPAQLMGLQDRGLLKEGYKADIVVFDPATIHHEGSFSEPDVLPMGILDVFINGKRVVEKGRFTGKLAGSVLRAQQTRVRSDIINP